MDNPEILWAQSKNFLFITFSGDYYNNCEIKVNTNSIILEKDGNNFNLEFLNNIDVGKSKWKFISGKLEFEILKEVPSFWEKLSDNKYNLRVNWNKWEDSDSEDSEQENIVSDFSNFTKTLPSDLMEKDFTDLFNENLDEDIISKMEEGILSSEDIESVSSNDSSGGLCSIKEEFEDNLDLQLDKL